MKRQLEYFMIDGAVGGNQEWFRNVVMYMGGLCGGDRLRLLYLFCTAGGGTPLSL